jgi:hypothetical protein
MKGFLRVWGNGVWWYYNFCDDSDVIKAMLVMKVQFTKIKNNHDRLRDDVIVGTSKVPEVGKCFCLVALPKGAATFRGVNTSMVMSIDIIDGGWLLHTRSGSIYEVVEIR